MKQFTEFIVNHMLLASAFIVILMLLVYEEMKRKVLGFKEIKPMDAVRLINHEDALVVDVRDVKDYQQGHVLNALHIPLHELEERLQGLKDHQTKPVIVYCRHGQSSAKAGSLLHKHGFEKTFKLAGGISSWQGADLPLSKK